MRGGRSVARCEPQAGDPLVKDQAQLKVQSVPAESPRADHV